MTTGLNFAIAYFIDDDTQIRLDVVNQIYERTTWDASKDFWEELGRSVSDSTATLTGGGAIIPDRHYKRRQIRQFRAFMQIGLGYYWAQWDDLMKTRAIRAV